MATASRVISQPQIKMTKIGVLTDFSKESGFPINSIQSFILTAREQLSLWSL